MSDTGVRKALEQMEVWLADPSKEFEASELAEWNEAYFSAVAEAKRGSGWPELVAHAHQLGDQLNLRLAAVIRERDEVKAELDNFARGNRALKGYGANTR